MKGYSGLGKLWAGRDYKQKEDFMTERAKEVLRAMGRIIDFDVSDIPADELKEIIENTRRILNSDFSAERTKW